MTQKIATPLRPRSRDYLWLHRVGALALAVALLGARCDSDHTDPGESDATGSAGAGQGPDGNAGAQAGADASAGTTASDPPEAGQSADRSEDELGGASGSGSAGMAAGTGAAGIMHDSGVSGSGAGGQAGAPVAGTGTGGSPEAGTGSADPGGCIRGGCSNQLCVDASEGDIVSTCEWHDSYACYAAAPCVRQADGLCGHTENAEFMTCIEEAGGTRQELCPPCVPPPSNDCVGSGPCGCGPYTCP